MKRRNFVLNTTLASLTALLPTSLLSATPSEAHAYAHPDLLQVIDDEKKVLTIGQSYRTSFPEFNSKERLLNTLRQAASPKSIKQRVQLDFDQGDIVQVDGWILSVTEARQCALYSLLNG